MIGASWPMEMEYSTGCPPIHVRLSSFATRNHSRHWLRGQKGMLRCFERWVVGNRVSIRTESMRAITPPSLLGMEHRLACVKRKKHSALMWGGVLSGLAGV